MVNPACPHGSPVWVCDGETEFCFRCASEIHAWEHPDGDVEGCRQCKYATILIAPSCRGSARNNIPPEGTAGRNSWERGIATDARGMPYRDEATGAPITVKRFAENRSRYEEALRRHAAGVI
jgi:hypothetical protein